MMAAHKKKQKTHKTKTKKAKPHKIEIKSQSPANVVSSEPIKPVEPVSAAVSQPPQEAKPEEVNAQPLESAQNKNAAPANVVSSEPIKPVEPVSSAVSQPPQEAKLEIVKAEEPENSANVVSSEPAKPVEPAPSAPPPPPQEAKPAEPASKNPLGDFKQKIELDLNMPDKPKKNYMWPILLIFLIAIILLAGVFAYRQGWLKIEKIKNLVPQNQTVTPTAVPSPTPTPTITVDLSEYEVQILNGSEVDGEASRQRESLEEEGFEVASIGNADSSEYTETIIEAKEDVDENFIARLKAFLDETFTVGEVEVLSEDASVPVVVTLGTKK